MNVQEAAQKLETTPDQVFVRARRLYPLYEPSRSPTTDFHSWEKDGATPDYVVMYLSYLERLRPYLNGHH